MPRYIAEVIRTAGWLSKVVVEADTPEQARDAARRWENGLPLTLGDADSDETWVDRLALATPEEEATEELISQDYGTDEHLAEE